MAEKNELVESIEVVARSMKLPTLQEIREASRPLREEAQRARTLAEEHEVTDDESADRAAELIGRLTRAIRSVEAGRKSLVAPLNEEHREVQSWAAELKDPLQEASDTLEKRVLSYRAEVRRAQLEEQRRRAEEERAAREAEERARAEADRLAREANERRIAAEAEAAAAERRRAAAAMAEANAKEETARHEAAAERAKAEAEQARHKAEEQRLALDALLAETAAATRELETREAARRTAEAPAALKRKIDTTTGTLTERTVWTYEIEEEAAVPRAIQVGDEVVTLLRPDRGAIRAAVNAGIRAIPGVRIFQTTNLAKRV